MAKPFKKLRDQMSEERQKQSKEKVKEALELLDLQDENLDLGLDEPTGPQVLCNACGLVGSFEFEEQEHTEVTFHIVRMATCGHGFVGSVMTEEVKDKIKKMESIWKRIEIYMRTRRLNEAHRAEAKHKTATNQVKHLQRKAWATHGHLVTDAVPGDHLLNDSRSQAT